MYPRNVDIHARRGDVRLRHINMLKTIIATRVIVKVAYEIFFIDQ
jgi:hypothetical protein